MNNTTANLVNSTINQTANQTTSQIPIILGSSLPLTFSPVLDIVIISFLVSAFVTLVNKFLGDQTKIKALKEEMKELKKKSRKLMTKDPKKAQQVQQEMMQKTMENMKHSMNPKIILTTAIPMILFLGLVRNLYAPFGNILDLGFTQFTWLGTYLIASIIWSMLLKKVLDVA
jgi:uncharacterized membrane protein (DUF106 family)